MREGTRPNVGPEYALGVPFVAPWEKTILFVVSARCFPFGFGWQSFSLIIEIPFPHFIIKKTMWYKYYEKTSIPSNSLLFDYPII